MLKWFGDREFLTEATRQQNEATKVSMNELASGLKVEALEDQSGLRVSYLGREQQLALSMVDALAAHATRRLLTEANDSSSQPKSQIEGPQLQSILEAEISARRIRDQHVDRVFGILEEGIDTVNDPQRERGAFFSPLVSIREPKPRAVKTPEPKREPNPEWQTINKKVEDLQQAYHELLANKTPEHPDALQLKSEINRNIEARDKLTQFRIINRFASEDGSDVVTPKPKNEDSSPLLVVNTKSMRASLEKYQKLKEKYEQSRGPFDESVNTSLSGGSQANRPPFAIASVIPIVQPAQIVARIGGKPSPQRIIVIGALSFLFGCIASWLSRTKRGANVLQSVDEVERELGIPVSGVIGEPAHAGPRPGTTLRSAASAVTLRGCEVTLALIVFVLVACSFSDSPFGNNLIGDPFGTISEAVDRTQHWLF